MEEVKRWRNDLSGQEAIRLRENGKITGAKEEYLGTERTPSGHNRIDIYLVLDEDGVYRLEYRLQMMNEAEMAEFCYKKDRLDEVKTLFAASLLTAASIGILVLTGYFLLWLCSNN